MRSRALHLIIIFLFAFLFVSCSCNDDDDDNDSSPAADDDTTDDDDDNDDDNDTTDDDDDDNDDNDDDDTVDLPWMMRPADLDGQPGDEIIRWRVYNDAGVNKAEFTLVATDGTETYTHPAVSVGTSGTAQYRVAEFDGAPPAEIVVTYQSINITKTSAEYESWAEVLQAPDFDPIATIDPVTNAIVWLNSDLDLNRDGHPDLVAETRPIDETTSGKLDIIDVANDDTLLTVNCGLGESAVATGVRGDENFMVPVPVSERTGEYFILTKRKVAGAGHVSVYLRDAENPVAEGDLLEDTDLAVVSSYDVELYDHDHDGFYDPFILLHEDTGHRYEYRTLFNGNIVECTSLSNRFVRDLDGDDLSDLVFTGSQCSQAKAGYAAVIYILSTDPENPVYQWTQGEGSLSPLFYGTAYTETGTAQIDDAPGEEFGMFAIDEGAVNWTGIDLFSPSSFSTPIWTTAELSPIGTPQSGGARIADYTGDGALDIAAYAIATYNTGMTTFFNTKLYLFEGPDLADISPYQKPGEYWTLGTLWDFDGDDTADLLLQRFLSGTNVNPKVILSSPANDFQVLYEYADTNAISMGLAGIYKIQQ